MSGTVCLTSDVKEVVDKFTSNGDVFSAYDITKEVNKNGPVARHHKIKALVHGFHQAGELGNNEYSRELITLDLGNDDAEAWVYYPHATKTAYDHPLAKSQTVAVVDDGSGVPVLDLDGLGTDDTTPDADNTGDDDVCGGCTGCDTTDDVDVLATVKVTGEHRIQIPKKVLRKLTISNSGYDISCNGEFYVKQANADGRVRITEPDYPAEQTLNLTIKNNTVHISPT